MSDLAIFLMDLRGGGAEKVMLNLAEGFAQRGVKVDLVIVQEIGAYLSQIPSNIRVVKLDRPRLVSSLPDLVRYLQQEQPKALISALEDTNIMAILARSLAGVSTRVIVTAHNDLRQEVQNATCLKRRVVPHLLRFFYPHATAIVGVSQGVVEALSHFGSPKSRTHVIYNPIVTQTLLTQIQEPVDHPWFQPNQPPVILGVGRLEQQKDFSTLIRAFSIVRQRQAVRLMILGEGDQRSQLEALIAQLHLEEDAFLPGFLSNPYSYMAQAALLVMSSLWEGFGNVLVEAMAAGTPVVATNCESGPAEILADGQYGQLVPIGDVDRMASAIDATLQKPSDPERLKQRSQDFSLEQAVSRYEELLQLAPHSSSKPALSCFVNDT